MAQEKKLSRRERERLRQRQDILAVALELFSLKGYHNVSMNEIAEKSEFAVGTLYNFFSNKENLYQSIMIDISDKFKQSLNMALEGGQNEIEKLWNYVRTVGEVFMENHSAVRLYHAETRGTSFNVKSGFEADVRKQYEDFQQQVATIFQRGMKKKRFNKIADPYHLAVALNSTINGFLFLWLEDSEKHPYPEDPDVILNIFFKGLLAEPPRG